MIRGLFTYLHRNKPAILKIVLIVLAISYFLMAMLPKHADFWLQNYRSAYFWNSPLNFYSVINEVTIRWPPVYPPTYFALQGAWLDLGSYLFHMGVAGIYLVNGASISAFSLWAIVPIMGALYVLVLVTYFTVDKKWLTIICFAPITFVAVIIMGQCDIYPVLFIFISLILMQRALKSERYLLYLLLAFVSLGISLQFKTYGALLFPAYILYVFAMGKARKIDRTNILLLVTWCSALFFIAVFIVWVPYGGLFEKVILGGKSNYVFQGSLFNGISTWLLGYIAIAYCMIVKIYHDSKKFVNDGRYYVFFNFLIVAWFFISVPTHPQWWLLLVPVMIMVLDRFRSRSGYILCGLIMVIVPLYLFVDRFTIARNLILLGYPVVELSPTLSMIVITCLAGLLAIWSFELYRELKKRESGDPM
jgi:hypothetical protein